MIQLLTDSILQHVALTEEEIARIPAYFETVKTHRGQFLLREGEICRYEFFVLKGCCRQYETDDAGKENVFQFSVEGWWMTDLDSMLHERPSVFNIDVLEAGEILQITKAQLHLLFQDIPAVERYYHIITQRSGAALQRRILFLQKPAIERYREFVTRYPFLETRLPQHQVAAYLGITKESLSRLRHKIARS
ncbi:Crp/Fnr family transcriptional regulator [Chitinophaga sp. 22321]|uniref:Crp/Fnr family transcriptional regulator n=1 Tax=Chitinophaga hostae TaxID=2831022 RepID=A0ABS5IXB9_9BACT|nr:Crp/Fnr family transcriptional regulator [Chitinophaga hostae]MBS0027525.1 Crp/Fnr family transcriptional regulator [Chitinophaga hostae]